MKNFFMLLTLVALTFCILILASTGEKLDKLESMMDSMQTTLVSMQTTVNAIEEKLGK